MLRIMMNPQGPAPSQAGPAPSALPQENPAQSPIEDHGDGSSQPGQTSQQIAGYMGPEKGPFECEHCIHFQDGGACDIVSGKIDPEGCCNLFEPDPNRRPEDGDDDNDEDDSGLDQDQGQY